MNSRDKDKWDKINEHKLSLSEVLYDSFGDSSNLDKELAERTLLGWIELIENTKFHKALKDSSVEDQIFISYIVKEYRTQKELVCNYNTTHQNISKKFNKVLDKLRSLIK